MGRIYRQPIEAEAVTAAQDLWEINAPSDAIVVIHKIHLFQNTDFADAEDEILLVEMSTSSGSGSGGSTPTPIKNENSDAAFGGTVEINNTTQGATKTVIEPMQFSVRGGLFYEPVPSERKVIEPSGRVIVDIEAPADSITVHGVMVFEEIG